MAEVLVCDIAVSKFEQQQQQQQQQNRFKSIKNMIHVHFRTNTLGKGMNPLIFPVICSIITKLVFYENGFALKKKAYKSEIL